MTNEVEIFFKRQLKKQGPGGFPKEAEVGTPRCIWQQELSLTAQGERNVLEGGEPQMFGLHLAALRRHQGQ